MDGWVVCGLVVLGSSYNDAEYMGLVRGSAGGAVGSARCWPGCCATCRAFEPGCEGFCTCWLSAASICQLPRLGTHHRQHLTCTSSACCPSPSPQVLHCRELGMNAMVVMEQYSELELLLGAARRLGVRPSIGIRAKLTTRHNGHWGSTSGDRAKVGGWVVSEWVEQEGATAWLLLGNSAPLAAQFLLRQPASTAAALDQPLPLCKHSAHPISPQVSNLRCLPAIAACHCCMPCLPLQFGLRAREIVAVVNSLAEEGMLDCLNLLHFHVGSQITNIRMVKEVGAVGRVA